VDGLEQDPARIWVVVLTTLAHSRFLLMKNSVNVAPVLRTGFFPDGRPGAGSGYTPDLVPEYFGLNDMLT
jgi:hypothetical protein